MDTLVVEDIMLLLLDDESGAIEPRAATHLHTILAGALLMDLSLTGLVRIETADSRWQSSKVHAESVPTPADPLLAKGFALVSEKPRSTYSVLNRLSSGLKNEVIERLVARRLVRAESGRFLGIFRTTSWPAQDSRHEDELRAALDATLLEGAVPDERTAAVIAILSASKLAQVIVHSPDVPAGTVQQRAVEIAEGRWAATAVQEAVALMNTAIAAATTAAITAAISSATTAAGSN